MNARSTNIKNITIMGLGQYGGGVGVTRYLADEYQTAHLTITDLATQDQLADSLSQINDLITQNKINLRLGEHQLDDFTTADLVIANPAVPKPWKNQYLLAAQNAHVPITTEIRLLIEALPPRTTTIGVTGSAGKSTTSSMIHHILKNQKHPSHLGGNLGGSLLNNLQTIHEQDIFILELSSAQLHWLGESIGHQNAPGWSPNIALLTNISPNHLDWHETLDHYQKSKENIFRYQNKSDIAIRAEQIDLTKYEKIIASTQLKIPGNHNKQNALLAAILCESAFKINLTTAIESLRSFTGLPHRLQLILETDPPNHLRFYNDSKATTPEATLLAVRAFPDPGKIHLIAGGYDKKINLTKVSNLAPTLAGLYTIGSTGKRIAESAHSQNTHYHETLKKAVQSAIPAMKPGDILLLSPASASWDQFTNFEQRGHAFTQLVRRLVK